MVASGAGLPGGLVGPPRGERRADAGVPAVSGHADLVEGGGGRGQGPRVLPAAEAADGETAVAHEDARLGDIAHREGDPPEHRVDGDLARGEPVAPPAQVGDDDLGAVDGGAAPVYAEAAGLARSSPRAGGPGRAG